MEAFDLEYERYQDSLDDKKQCKECGKKIDVNKMYCSESCLISSNR